MHIQRRVEVFELGAEDILGAGSVFLVLVCPEPGVGAIVAGPRRVQGLPNRRNLCAGLRAQNHGLRTWRCDLDHFLSAVVWAFDEVQRCVW